MCAHTRPRLHARLPSREDAKFRRHSATVTDKNCHVTAYKNNDYLKYLTLAIITCVKLASHLLAPQVLIRVPLAPAIVL